MKIPVTSRQTSIKDAIRPGTNDWCISSETANSIRPSKIRSKDMKEWPAFFLLSKAFNHKIVRTAYAGMCKKLEMI